MNLSRSSLFGTVSLSVLIAALLWWYDGAAGVASNTLFAQNIIPERWAPLEGFTDFWGGIVTGVMSLLCGLVLIQVAAKNMFYYNKNLSSMILFVLFSSFFLPDSGMLSPMVATIIMVFSYGNILRSYPLNNPAVRKLFHSSFYFGVAVMIYPPYIYFMPMMWVLLSMVRLPEVREWIVTSVIWLLPFGLYFMTGWVLGDDITTQWNLFLQAVSLNDGTLRALDKVDFLGIIGVYILLLVVVFALGVISFLKYYSKFRKRGKAAITFFIIFTIWALAIMLFSPVRSLYISSAVAVGLSIVLPVYFGNESSYRINILYLLVILLGVFVHFV